MEFNAPLAVSPRRMVVELKVGAEILAVMGEVYVKLPEKLAKDIEEQNHVGNYGQALFKEEFIKLNPKIFKPL